MKVARRAHVPKLPKASAPAHGAQPPVAKVKAPPAHAPALETPPAQHLAGSLPLGQAVRFPEGLALEVRDAALGSIAFRDGVAASALRLELEQRGVTLLAVRHGQSESNALSSQYGEPVLAGRADAPLTEKGRHQAAVAARSLYEELGGRAWLERAKHDPSLLPVLYASPLQRTQQTAAAFVELLAHEGGPRLSLEVDPRITEIDYGELDLKPLSHFRAAAPALFDSWEAFQARGVNFLDGFPGGERRLDVLHREAAFVADVADRHAGRTVIAFTHLEAMVGLQVATANVARLDDGTLHVNAARIPNASVMHLTGPKAPHA